MPEGPAERGVEANAKSMDGAEHSARLEGVMAAVQRESIACRTSAPVTGFRVGDDRDRNPVAERRSDRGVEARSPRRRSAVTIMAPRPLPQRHASRGVNDPTDSGAGPPRARGTGVVHTTACFPSPTPWCADGRQKAPPDRGDVDDKCLSGFAIGALAWRKALSSPDG